MLPPPFFISNFLHLHLPQRTEILHLKQIGLHWTEFLCYLHEPVMGITDFGSKVSARTVLFLRSHWCDLRGFDDSHGKCGTFGLRLLPILKSLVHLWYQSLENKSRHIACSFIQQKRLSEKKKSQRYLTCTKMLGGCFTQHGQKAALRFLIPSVYCFAPQCEGICVQIQMQKFEPSFRSTYNSHVVGSFGGWTSMEKGNINSCLKSKSSICNFRHTILPYTTDNREPTNFCTLS